jgi:di/tricarboxylate transporter
MHLIIPIVFAVIILFSPIPLSLNQKAVVITMMTTIYWWATGGVNMTFSAIFMLIGFLLFSGAHPVAVLNFPLSLTFVLILSSFLLANGITNTRAAEQLAELILQKFGTSTYRLIALSFILGGILIFLIPHPFPRLIILGSIYSVFLSQYDMHENTKSVVMISVFVAGTVVPTLFINGDFILNYSALEFAGVSASFTEWATYMTVPGIIASAVICGALIFMFRKNLKGIELKRSIDNMKLKLNKERKLAFIIMGVVVVLWATESLHNIHSAYVGILGVIAMFATKLLRITDFKKINYPILIYLTAVFSIGRVLAASGINEILQNSLAGFVPQANGLGIYFFIVFVVMAVHMVLGSCLTTMSITSPLLVGMVGGIVPPIVIALISYLTVSIHYILPYHHLSVLIGVGEEYYSEAQLRRYGLFMTPLTFLIIFLLYLPWWNLVGLLR